MRYSAIQENSYGVGLGQETYPNHVDESMMAATGDVETSSDNSFEEGSMISNLPLLFANGYPTSLEKISLPELERFVTFMIQCSLGNNTSEAVEPQWWPKEVKFSNPIQKPKIRNEDWMANLKKIVFRCYTYHRSEYLLRFCSCLAQYDHDKLQYVNNYDSTTSLFNKTTGELLVTFRNENMNYDRKIECNRKKLLVASKSKSKYSNGTKCLRPRAAHKSTPSPALTEPSADDIYLCDNCDAELIGHRQMQEHEKLCYRVEPRPPTPKKEAEPEIQQHQFMEYFKLKSLNPSENEHSNTNSKIKDINQNRSSSRSKHPTTLTRYPMIPFSSPVGISLAKKSKMMTEESQQERLERVERHLIAPPISASFRPKWLSKINDSEKWLVTFKPNREKIKDNSFVHQYNFANHKNKLAIDLRSQLLFLACKPIYVVLPNLTDKQIEELKINPRRYKTPDRQIIINRPPSVMLIDEPILGDESNPIVIEDEETPLPPAKDLSKCHKNLHRNLNIAKRPKLSQSVILVDLCSSDDEETTNSNSVNTTDENRDPLRKLPEIRLERNYLSTLSPRKSYQRPLNNQSDIRNWTTNLNLNSANTLQKKTILKDCASFSTVL